MKKCFVITPIGEEGSEVRKKADKVFKYIISPVCAACELEAIRSDKENQIDSINQTIIVIGVLAMLFIIMILACIIYAYKNKKSVAGKYVTRT